MISAAEFFSEYDALQKTASDAEREAWLISQCEMANPEGPQEQRVLSTMYNELGSFYKHRDMLERRGSLSESERALGDIRKRCQLRNDHK